MAEGYDAAIRRRLGLIDSMGSDATQAFAAQRPVANTERPTMNRPGGYTPVGNASQQFGEGHSYRGPRGNQQALINFGRMLQSQGFRISENSAFNGGKRITGGHSSNSRHYSDRAIDVNRYAGTSRREQQAIDRIVGLARAYGLRSIWRKPGHFNHAHFDY